MAVGGGPTPQAGRKGRGARGGARATPRAAPKPQPRARAKAGASAGAAAGAEAGAQRAPRGQPSAPEAPTPVPPGPVPPSCQRPARPAPRAASETAGWAALVQLAMPAGLAQRCRPAARWRQRQSATPPPEFVCVDLGGLKRLVGLQPPPPPPGDVRPWVEDVVYDFEDSVCDVDWLDRPDDGGLADCGHVDDRPAGCPTPGDDDALPGLIRCQYRVRRLLTAWRRLAEGSGQHRSRTHACGYRAGGMNHDAAVDAVLSRVRVVLWAPSADAALRPVQARLLNALDLSPHVPRPWISRSQVSCPWPPMTDSWRREFAKTRATMALDCARFDRARCLPATMRSPSLQRLLARWECGQPGPA